MGSEALQSDANACSYRACSCQMKFVPDQVLQKTGGPDGTGAKRLFSQETLAAAYNFTGDMLCFGGHEGTIHFYHTALHPYKPANFEFTAGNAQGKALTSAITSLQFRPGATGSAAVRLLLATTSDGGVSIWHLGSKQLLEAFYEDAITEHASVGQGRNQIYASAFSFDGGRFVTAGKDALVRLYDAESMQLIERLSRGYSDDLRSAHSLTVTATRWIDENTLLTGGWDRTVQIWDIRAGRSVRAIMGPYLCGDGLDFHAEKKLIVTASTRGHNRLELWDFLSGAKFSEVAWPTEPREKDPEAGAFVPSDLMTCHFSADGRYLAVGGNHDMRVFDSERLFSGQFGNAVIGELFEGGGCRSAVLSLAWAPHGDHVVVCGATTQVLSTGAGILQ
jgi:COMPASS component SWD3